MLPIKKLLKIIPLFSFLYVQAQTSYTQLGHKEYNLIDRLEIKSRQPGFMASYIKPFNNRLLVQEMENLDSLYKSKNRVAVRLTNIDKYNISRYLMAHKEYATKPINTKKELINVVEINKKNFFFTLNPAIQYRSSVENSNKANPYLVTGGITSTALIAKKIGINLYATGNRERLPVYAEKFRKQFNAIPGFSNYNMYDTSTTQYFDIRGSVQWTLAKKIDMQVGYDRVFLGNGQRSLLLSDFSGSSAFVKINTRLGKFNFENLYMQLTPQFGIVNKRNFKKYLRINTLSFNATKWLNLGIFDAVSFGRENQFELNYLLPFTFLRSMEQQSGSPDNALVGLNVKANLHPQVQVYGQILLDEFKLSEIRARSGWWANKFGYQIGAKYIDAFNLPNLDIQVEANRVRPFTYTHFDSISNYSHNSLALAHPLGANFNEVVLNVVYQPMNKLTLQSKLIYYYQGTDTANLNMGSNILRNYNPRPFDFNWKVGSGNKVNCLLWNVQAIFEVAENLFIDAGVVYRNFRPTIGKNETTTIINLGFRWNITNRTYDF